MQHIHNESSQQTRNKEELPQFDLIKSRKYKGLLQHAWSSVTHSMPAALPSPGHLLEMQIRANLRSAE